MRPFIIATYILIGLSLQSQSNCDSLYNKYNPEYLSYKTTSLIMRQILDNCVEKNIQPGRVTVDVDRPGKITTFVPGRGGVSQRRVDGTSQFQTVSTFGDLFTSIPSWFVADPLAPANTSLNVGRVKEVLTDENQNGTGNLEIPAPSQGGSSGRRVRKRNNKKAKHLSKGLNPSSNKNNAIDQYSRITQSTADSLLSERIILMSADFADCLYNSNSDVFLNNDTSLCFQHTVMTPITGEVMDDSLVVERRDFINDLSVDRIRNILISSEIDEQDFELIYRDSLDEVIKIHLDSILNNLILVTYIDKQQELPNIYKSYNEVLDTLLTHTDELLAALKIEKIDVEEFTAHTKSLDPLNVDIISKNRKLLEGSLEKIDVNSDLLYNNPTYNTKVKFREDCENENANCPPSILKEKGTVSSTKRASYDKKRKVQNKSYELYEKIKESIAVLSLLNLKDSDQMIDYMNPKDLGKYYLAKGSYLIEKEEVKNVKINKGIRESNPEDLIRSIEEMVDFLDIIDNGSEEIEIEIDSLREVIDNKIEVLYPLLDSAYRLHFDMLYDHSVNTHVNREFLQFTYSNKSYTINEFRDRHELGQSIIQSQLRTLLNDEFNNCTDIYYGTIQNSDILSNLNTYQNYLDIYSTGPNECNTCITSLISRLNTSAGSMIGGDGNPSYPFFRIDGNSTSYIADEVETFNRMAKLFEELYSSDLDFFTDLLYVQPATVDSRIKIINEYRENGGSDYSATPENILQFENYLDPSAFAEFVEIYDVFYPYIEIHDFDSNPSIYAPRTTDDLVDYSTRIPPIGGANIKQTRQGRLARHIDALTNIHEIILAQQSLMSGNLMLRPLYMIIYQDQYSEREITYFGETYSYKQFAVDLLNRNPILSTNFATYVLSKNYRLTESIYKDTTNWMDGEARNPSKEALLSYGFDSLQLYNYHPKDSISFIPDSYSSVDVSNLGDFTSIDALDFDEWDVSGTDNIALLEIDISQQSACDPDTDDDHLCQVSIPFPESSMVLFKKFIFNAPYYQALKTKSMIDKIGYDIEFGNNLSGGWQGAEVVKSIFINQE